MIWVLGWMLFRLIVGVIAKLVMPGRDPGGIFVTMLIGIVGAVLGGFLGRASGGISRASLPGSLSRRWGRSCCCSFTAKPSDRFRVR